MSSYLPKLWGDINDRLYGDTAAGGLFASGSELVSGAWNTRAPASSALPYIIYALVSDRPTDSFDTAISEVIVQVSVFHDAEPAGGGNPLEACATINARIVGDWMDQSNSLPTFGLARFQPTLAASGWSASLMHYDGCTERHEDGVYNYVHVFRVFVSR